MALAILYNGELSDRGWSFRIDIGKNKFYRFVVGKDASKNANGLKVIQERTYVSPLTGLNGQTSFGRSMINVPLKVFSKEASFIQLYSYRTKDLKGVAISDVQEVKPSLLKEEDLVLPDISFSYNLNYVMDHQQSTYTFAENVPFSYRERRMSNAMFLENITRIISGMLPQVLPALSSAVPVLGSLLSGVTGGGSASGNNTATATAPASGGAATAITTLLNSPEVSRLIQDLLTRTLQGNNSTPAAAGALAQQHALAESFARYSEAKIAPALLAALPALMPLLQQVLSPETIGRVLEQPQRMIGAVTDSLVNLGRVGIESHEQDLRHLRELHNVNGPPVDALLASMSLSIDTMDKLTKFRRIETVKLKFANTATVAIEGNQRVVYTSNQAISFPLVFESPGAVSNAQLQLSIKRASNSKLLHVKTYKVKRVHAGPVNPTPGLSLEDIQQKLKPNEEYLVSAQLTWKNKKGETVGVVMSQVIYLMHNFIYGGTDQAGEPIPLNDVEKFREFWHKIWSVNFKPEKKRFKIDCKYYYILENKKNTIGRMETLTKVEDGFPITIKMKSGSILNVKSLNALIPKISQYPLLTDEELAALDSETFTDRFHTVARLTLDFNGYDKENAVLWVYPEVKILRFILKSPVEVNANGAVTNLVDKSVYFPIPSSVHFIGGKSGN